MNPLWQPSDAFIQGTHLRHFMDWLEKERDLPFQTYDELWQWSVDYIADFWEAVWDYFEVVHHRPYRQVLVSEQMPGAVWFEEAKLNYAENVFRHYLDAKKPKGFWTKLFGKAEVENAGFAHQPAIIFSSEKYDLVEITWEELYQQVASLAAYLRESGVKKGDRVVAYLPNIPEATIAFLATISVGAIWSSCSPDFGVNSVLDRWLQIEPKILFAVDGYTYGGKVFDKKEAIAGLGEKLTSLEEIIVVPYLAPAMVGASPPLQRSPFGQPTRKVRSIFWNESFRPTPELRFELMDFNDPLYVLYSSGTTGIPKAITHSHGGNLLEHLKYLHFHNDVHPGERFFWFSTTGWMMWNFVQASLLTGATMVLYDGSPGYPDLNRLWKLAEAAKINHFGTSAPFLVACMKEGIQPGKDFDLSALRSIGSTGSPLPPEAYEWVYAQVKKDLWLSSMAGGTDVCTAWVGGCPMEPVYSGEIQRRCLGAALEAWNENGDAVTSEVGEMVVTKPMPSMPLFFWNDPGMERYRASYFEMYPDVWRHGDWMEITERNTIIIYGRSDATLNRQGVRIGTAEIYRVVEKVPGVKDSFIVSIERADGSDYMPLFIVTTPGVVLDEDLKKSIIQTLRKECSPRHVPDEIIAIEAVPYTISGKKMETPVKKILMGKAVEKAANVDSMRNPEALGVFLEMGKKGKR